MRRLIVSGVGAALLLANATAPTYAQTQPAPQIAFAPVLEVANPVFEDRANVPSNRQFAAIVVSGNEAVDDTIFQPRLAEYFGEDITEERLAELSNEVSELAKGQGYEYAQSEVVGDPNGLGIVEVRLDEGVVGSVEIDGYDNAVARGILENLIGKPITKADLERALLLVSDVPAVRLRSANFKRVYGRGVVAVKLTRRSDYFRVAADNYGSQAFGPVRARGSAVASDVISSGDQVRAAVRINPVDLGELLFLSASYETQIGTDGVTLSVSGSVGTTEPGGSLEDSDITGESVRAGAQLAIPVFRTKKASLWVQGRVNYISIEQDDIGEMLRNDTLVTAEIGLRTQFVVSGARVRAGISHVRGLDMFGATRLNAPLGSRFDGDGVFSKIEFWSDARLSLNDRIDLFFAMGGQIADRALLGSEELGLGGAYRTRGYNFSEVLGDEGIYGLAELRYKVNTNKLPLDRLQLYAFVDGGVVNDIGQDFGEGSLFSAGPGLRARMGPVDLELETGFPLGGTGERRAEDGPQVNVRAGVNF